MCCSTTRFRSSWLLSHEMHQFSIEVTDENFTDELTYLLFQTRHCNTLQHSATHCNTLQHTATHCNTLQHTATLCNTLQHSATLCNTLQHTATHCHTLQHTTTHCNTPTSNQSSEPYEVAQYPQARSSSYVQRHYSKVRCFWEQFLTRHVRKSIHTHTHTHTTSRRNPQKTPHQRTYEFTSALFLFWEFLTWCYVCVCI